jgi:hypothetical protein
MLGAHLERARQVVDDDGELALTIPVILCQTAESGHDRRLAAGLGERVRSLVSRELAEGQVSPAADPRTMSTTCT